MIETVIYWLAKNVRRSLQMEQSNSGPKFVIFLNESPVATGKTCRLRNKRSATQALKARTE